MAISDCVRPLHRQNDPGGDRRAVPASRGGLVRPILWRAAQILLGVHHQLPEPIQPLQEANCHAVARVTIPSLIHERCPPHMLSRVVTGISLCGRQSGKL
jgi:hypothetical protein